MPPDFQVKDAPTALCAQCGLPMRSQGRRAGDRLCSPSCRVTRAVFGGGRNGTRNTVRPLVGFWALGLSFASGVAMEFLRVTPETAMPILWAQAGVFVVVFLCFALPQWQGPSDEATGLRHESVVVLACVLFALDAARLLSQDSPVALFQPTLVLALLTLGNLLETENRVQGARALGPLLDEPPKTVTGLSTGAPAPLPVTDLHVGDRFLVQPGESVPLECTLAEGKALLSVIRVSGSAEPLTGGPGLAIPAGAVNLGTPLTVAAARAGSSASWLQVHRGLNDLIVLGRETSAGAAGLFTNGDFFLLLLAAGVVFWNLDLGTTAALSRGLAVLGAGGAGTFLASRDLAVALTGRSLARAGVAARTLEAIYDAAEAPIGDGTLAPTRAGPLKFLREGGVEPLQWQETVQSCRRLRYNMQSSPWILLLWNSVGIALAASGVLLPGMAAGFALLGSVFLTHRALKLSKKS